MARNCLHVQATLPGVDERALVTAAACLTARIEGQTTVAVAVASRDATRTLEIDLSGAPSFAEARRRTDAATSRTGENEDVVFTISAGATIEIAHALGEELVAQLSLLLAAMASDPDARFDAPSLFTDRARTVLADAGTPIEVVERDPVHVTIAHLADTHGDRLALEWRETAWSFRELETRVARLASALRTRGVAPGDRVMITGARCPSVVAAILATWRCGATIVPLGGGVPASRREVMVRQTRAAVVVHVGANPEAWTIPVATVDETTTELEAGASVVRAAEDLPRPDDGAAYVFFTSGTTGEPKGILGTHRGLAHFVAWQKGTFGIHDDRAAQLTGLSFDVVMRDMFTALSAGATLCFPDREAASLDPDALFAWLRDRRITMLHSVPSILEAWFAAWTGDPTAPEVRLVFMAGEPLPDTLVQRIRTRFPATKVVNLYGPTETTLAKCAFEVPAKPTPGIQPVGCAMRGAQVIVVNEAGTRCGIGEPGEILVRTPYRTRGYLDESRSGGRFRPNPFRDDPDDIVYATGDRGRHREDGILEILGRVDDQVKIHGVRVEPAEVSAAIRTHPHVTSCFVGAVVDVARRTTLCAWVVSSDGLSLDGEALRAHLAARLPSAMVPASFVFLPRLPLTANGKVDRKALPPPSAADGQHVAPVGETEIGVASAYAAVFGLPQVGALDDFLELGGHSLLATTLAARLQRRFGVQVPVKTFFEARTPRAVAQAVASAPRAERTEIPRVSRDAAMPVSSREARLWFLQQLDPESRAYNEIAAMRIRGRVDREALQRAFVALEARHEALRTRYVDREGVPLREIQPPRTEVQIVHVDARDEADAIEHVRAISRRRWTLVDGHLYQPVLARFGEEDILAIAIHHIVSDGWSANVLLRDLARLYVGEPLPSRSIDYADFSAWERDRGGKSSEDVAYFVRQLEGVEDVDLPTDRPRPTMRRFAGARVGVTVDGALARSIAALALREGTTSHVVLLAALATLVHRHCETDRFALALPVANRTIEEVEHVVGFFVDTVAIDFDFTSDVSFRSVVRRTRDRLLEAHAHATAPFDRVVEATRRAPDPGRPALCQIAFAPQPREANLGSFGALAAESLAVDLQVSKFDLSLFLNEVEAGFRGSLEYDAELFDRATAQDYADRFMRLLAAGAGAPDTAASALPLLSAEERHTLLVAWNDTARPYPRDGTIDGLFREHAARTPDAIAVTCGTSKLTYAELAARAAKVAGALAAAGVGRGDRVGISSLRSLAQIAGLLGILQAGASYVPLDPAYPDERIALLVEQAAIRVVLDDEGKLRLPAHAHALQASDVAKASPRAPSMHGANDAAYVLFTSGSTGTPKGVIVEHRGVIRLVRNVAYMTVDGTETFLSFAPLSFDASTLEIWGPLLNGARLVVAPPGALGMEELGALIRDQGVTSVLMTSGVFNQLVDQAPHMLGAVKQFMTGGDVFSIAHAKKAVEQLPATRIINVYGPTENATFTTTHLLEAPVPDRPVPIGVPVSNTTVYVVDAHGEPVPPGVVGELWTGGDGLARGYLDARITAEKFIPDPFGPPGTRLYRTGDRARYRRDGVIDFLGRRDGQVKLRGFRIELGEIEVALGTLRGVGQAVVVVRLDAQRDKRLVAYVEAKKTERPTSEELRAELQRRLPDHMVPSAIVVLDELPLNAHGKVDKKALPAPDFAAAAGPYVAPSTKVEAAIAAAFQELLGLELVGIHDDFFALGGHSLLATRLVARLRADLASDVAVRTVFEARTVAALAAQVRTDGTARSTSAIAAVSRERPIEASFAQERLWVLDQLDPGLSTYNVPLVLRLRGALDFARLQRALDAVVARHEALRTTFVAVDGRPFQEIHPPSSVPMARMRARDEEEETALVRAAANEPFDLARGPLVRARLLERNERENVLVLVLHHIVTDGWSMHVLANELAASFSGRDLPAPTLQYADFAAWQRTDHAAGAADDALAWFARALEGAPAVLDLPTDRPRPSIKGDRGGMVRTPLSPGLAAALSTLAREEGATSFMVLLAAFDVFLARHTGQRDVVVGVPTAARTRPELESIIGFFVNTLAIRADLRNARSFRDALRVVKSAALGAFDHQDAPFERVVAAVNPPRDRARTPLFQVMFAHEGSDTAMRVELEGLDVTTTDAELDVAKFDLHLTVAELDGRFEATFQYDRDLFDRTTVERMARRFETLLVAALDAPDAGLDALPLVPGDERSVVLERFNATSHDFGPATRIHDLFAASVHRTPDAVAVEDARSKLTYRDVDALADRVAGWIVARGLRPEARVALELSRSASIVAALLGVLRAGAAYVPVDPKLPDDRRTFMKEDAECVLGIDDRVLAEILASDPGGPVRRAIDPTQLAYVLYTSGSTGRPKGVMVEHRGVVNLVRSMLRDPGMKPTDVQLALTTLSFDVSVAEIFLPLAAGARVVVATEDDARDPALLAALIARKKPNIAGATPATWRMLTADGWRPNAGMEIHCAGEALPRDLADVLVESGASLFNYYGPTETTVYATGTPVARDARITIGRPLDNTRLYILDDALEPAPVGVPGQLFIAGDNVTRGYLRRPALSAEKFVPDHFAKTPGARMYATGDLARWLPDGTVDYLGRNDHQVKVRGFRIELGEIEAALKALAGIREVVVVARADARGDKLLVAYVVREASSKSTSAALSAELKRSLPEYMVPTAFVFLDRLPRTGTGKIDRNALPAPDFAASAAEYVAPRSPIEQAVADAFRDLLRIDRVGAHDDFFALGGHSLLATRLVARLRSEIDATLAVRTVFEAPTVAALSAQLRPNAQRAASIPRIDRAHPIQASFAQERLWLLDQLDPGLPTYNVPLVLRLRGALDVNRLQRTLDSIVARHEVLRTTFTAADGRPLQIIHPPSPVDIVRVSARTDVELRDLVNAATHASFDLGRGPLVRATLVTRDQEEHVLVVVVHHVVTDGWSTRVFLAEIEAAWHGRPLPDLAIQYADYSAWQRAEHDAGAADESLDWFVRALEGAPNILDLPTDRPRPAIKRDRGGAVRFSLDRRVAERVSELAKREGATTFMVLLAAFDVFLARHAGQRDLVVGVPIAGRTRPELDPLVGFFVNTLAIRADLRDATSFRDALRVVKSAALGAFDHQDVPFERVVAAVNPPRDRARTPLFQVMFAHEHETGGTGPRITLEGLDVTTTDAELDVAKFDLSFTVAERREGLEASFQYDRDLFDRTTVERMARRFETLLIGALDAPDAGIEVLPIVPSDERGVVLERFNATSHDLGPATCIHDLFAASVRRAPDAVAVEDARVVLTYRDVDALADRVAGWIAARELRPEARVALELSRSASIVPALLGVLRAGAAYVPVDPKLPADRRAFMKEDAECVLVIDDRALAEILASDPRAPVRRAIDPTQLAYVLYTSGSTGRPKGVMVEHRGVVNLVRSMLRDPGMKPTDVQLALTTLSFDVSVAEIFLPLAAGARVVVATEEDARDPALLAALIARKKPNIAGATPATWRMLTADGWRPNAGMEIHCAGEALPRDLADVLVESGASLFNYYGPTETTVYATGTPVARDARITIGRPLDNTRLYILDDALEPTPVGVPGQLFIAGDNVTRGYLRRPALSAEKFVPDHFATAPGARMYATGDLARWLADGTVDYLGRNDHQVKVRGFRIELGEIEAALKAQAGVREVVVVARTDARDEKLLVAYVVSSSKTITSATLSTEIRRTLPEYMVPTAFVFLDRLPRTGTGKIDRNALPAPDFAASAAEYVAPRSPAEQAVANAFRDLLHVERVGANDDFFALGGHSLLATRLVARLRSEVDASLAVRTVFEASTVAALAANLRADAQRAQSIPRIDRSRPIRASFAQERLWLLDQLDPGLPTYNVPLVLRLRGALDVERLQRALDAVVARHEALRTTFTAVDGHPLQVIHPPRRVDIARVTARTDVELRDLVGAATHASFDLGRGPLFRATLVTRSAGEHLLVLVIHHVVTDGWSTGILLADLEAAWHGRALPDLRVQYADYSAWQRAEHDAGVADESLDWFVRALEGAPTFLDLPADRARPTSRRDRGGAVRFSLDRRAAERVSELAKREGATTFMVLLAAFDVFLARHAGQRDVVVGVPIAGRTRPELDPLVGFFVNTLAIRADLRDATSFRDALRVVKSAALGAFDHQDVPFERVVAAINPPRDRARTPLFQVMFVHRSEDEARKISLDGLGVTFEDSGLDVAKFDLTLTIAEQADRLDAELEYDADLFDHATAARMAERFTTLLEHAVTAPDTGIFDLDAMPAVERERVLSTWNQTALAYDGDQLADRRFSEQAARTPDAPAIDDGIRSLTFAELDARANELAAGLVEAGVGVEDVVAVRLPRSVDLFVAFLAIWKAGGAYLPIDYDAPEERVRYILDDSRAALLTSVHGELRVTAAKARGKRRAVRTSDALAYVIYTSGSTGRPKGTGISHRTVLGLVAWHRVWFALEPGVREAQFSNVAFDAHVAEVWPALLAGAAVFVVPEGVRTDPDAYAAWLVQNRIHLAFAPTILADDMLARDWPAECALRWLTIAGDALGAVPDRKARFQVLNAYGPTECTVAATAGVVAPGEPRPDIGGPLPNVRVYVLDPDGRPLPIGVPGELCIGGALVGRGYVDRPALTAEKFVPDPFTTTPGARMYRTGDLVRWLPSGRIEFRGRIDHQVKIRGYRIELGEIEETIRSHPTVRDVVVVARDRGAAKLLVAYWVGDRQAGVDLRAHCERTLPRYMVPTAFVLLDALPLNANRKVDRAALPEPDPSTSGEDYVAPRTDTEHAVAALFRDVLRVERVGVHDDFFALGGNSMLVAKLVAQVRLTFDTALPFAVFFERPTVERLAVAIESGRSQKSTLLRMREGDESAALVLVAPVGGKLAGYFDLVSSVGDLLVLGLRAMGLGENEQPLETVEEMAEAHVRSLVEAHPGPYVLVGWSFGGLLAFEIARRLELAGRRVADVIAIDSYPGQSAPSTSETELLGTFFVDIAGTRGAPMRAPSSRDPASMWDEAVRAGVVEAEQLDTARRAFAVFRANLAAASRYTPPSAPIDVHWFRAADGQDSRQEEIEAARAAWQQAARAVHEKSAAADHYSITRKPAVTDIVRAIVVARDRAVRYPRGT